MVNLKMLLFIYFCLLSSIPFNSILVWRQAARFVWCENELLHKTKPTTKTLRAPILHSTYVSSFNSAMRRPPKENLSHNHQSFKCNHKRRAGEASSAYFQRLNSQARLSEVLCCWFYFLVCVFEDHYYTICARCNRIHRSPQLRFMGLWNRKLTHCSTRFLTSSSPRTFHAFSEF